jgi:hypothetical protein
MNKNGVSKDARKEATSAPNASPGEQRSADEVKGAEEEGAAAARRVLNDEKDDD